MGCGIMTAIDIIDTLHEVSRCMDEYRCVINLITPKDVDVFHHLVHNNICIHTHTIDTYVLLSTTDEGTTFFKKLYTINNINV